MMEIDLSIKIGGEAGQGLQSIGYILSKSLAKGGFFIFANMDVMSRIRGGHNFFQIRISEEPIQAISEKIHLLIALDEQSIIQHQHELVKGGMIIYNGKKTSQKDLDRNLLTVPFGILAKERIGKSIMANSVAAGSALSLLNYDFNYLKSALNEEFKKKSVEIAEKNIEAAFVGYEYLKEKSNDFKYEIKPISTSHKRLLLTGNEAIASGALISGCKFLCGYPMSPSTPIQQYFASKMKDYPIAYDQAEDEIAAINMILGASFAGVRAMTATSGGGFSLMTEGLSLAGMTETPAVIVIAQRPGPATGFPTRTEQGELEFVIHAGHGEFPRAVFAPGNAEQAFYLTSKAFNLSEKYQIPVIILSDQHLSDSYYTVESFDISKIKIERGEFYSPSDKEKYGEYKRHRITDSGISPRLFPGEELGFVVTDSDEHTEEGHITEDAETRNKNVNKRLKKLEKLKDEISPPFEFGPNKAEVLLIGWGSSFGAIKEAVDLLNSEGQKTRMLHFSEIWPFPVSNFLKAVKDIKLTINIENNSTGQFAHIIRAETGFEVNSKILRYDGRPLSPAYIIYEMERLR
jgi:2-oxoglutarate ferredoxin oxidoreductase subunit alpha